VIWIVFLTLIHAQTTQRQLERMYKDNKTICDMRIETINNKANYMQDVLKRNSPFEIEGQGQSYDDLLADAAYATSGNISMTVEEIKIPTEMMIHIPVKNAEMKEELKNSIYENAVTKPLPDEQIPEIKGTRLIKTNTSVRCIPGGFVVPDTPSFAYDRDCRAPNEARIKIFSNQLETIQCAPKKSSGEGKDKFKPLSMCHPMLYGAIPQKKEDGTLYAQGICVFPEDFDSVAFNRSHSLNKLCDRLSDFVGSEFLPRKLNDERPFDERMLEFIARTNLKNYEEWKLYSQNILNHCSSTENKKEIESCVIAKERVQAIQDEIARLTNGANTSLPAHLIQ
jgi:predicted DNA-binding ArsR family transcriptional regulator